MKVKILTHSYTQEAGFSIIRVYLEPDFDRAKADFDLLKDVPEININEYQLIETILVESPTTRQIRNMFESRDTTPVEIDALIN